MKEKICFLISFLFSPHVSISGGYSTEISALPLVLIIISRLNFQNRDLKLSMENSKGRLKTKIDPQLFFPCAFGLFSRGHDFHHTKTSSNHEKMKNIGVSHFDFDFILAMSHTRLWSTRSIPGPSNGLQHTVLNLDRSGFYIAYSHLNCRIWASILFG